jgi:hypothetical protein
VLVFTDGLENQRVKRYNYINKLKVASERGRQVEPALFFAYNRREEKYEGEMDKEVPVGLIGWGLLRLDKKLCPKKILSAFFACSVLDNHLFVHWNHCPESVGILSHY